MSPQAFYRLLDVTSSPQTASANLAKIQKLREGTSKDVSPPHAIFACGDTATSAGEMSPRAFSLRNANMYIEARIIDIDSDKENNMVATVNPMTFLIQEPAEVYHAKARDYLSSHQLGAFRKSPFLYYKKKNGLVPDEDRPAYVIGRAAHTLILEGRKRFEQEYVVGGPINPNTGNVYGSNTKAFSEWALAQGKPVLTQTQFELVRDMAIGVAMSDEASGLLADGIAEGVVRADYCDVPSQIRMDFLDPHKGIVDLKTCDDLTWFESDARRFGYSHQLAFYGTGGSHCEWHAAHAAKDADLWRPWCGEVEVRVRC